jgi:hypothetical protein
VSGCTSCLHASPALAGGPQNAQGCSAPAPRSGGTARKRSATAQGSRACRSAVTANFVLPVTHCTMILPAGWQRAAAPCRWLGACAPVNAYACIRPSDRVGAHWWPIADGGECCGVPKVPDQATALRDGLQVQRACPVSRSMHIKQVIDHLLCDYCRFKSRLCRAPQS